MTAYITYLLYLGILIFLIGNISIFIIKKKLPKITYISTILFIGLYMGAVWLLDLTTLDMSKNGIKSTSGLVSNISSQVPSLFIYLIAIFSLGLIMLFFEIINKKIAFKHINSIVQIKPWNYVLLLLTLFGYIWIIISSILLILMGHDAIIILFNIKFYLLGLYHGSLPLIIIPILILAIHTEYDERK